MFQPKNQVDEDDVFICGRCKASFNHLDVFVQHKNSRECFPVKVVQLTTEADGSASHVPLKTGDNELSASGGGLAQDPTVTDEDHIVITLLADQLLSAQ